jgi:hypothetical protein
MAKGQKRSTREVKKPKAGTKKAAASAVSVSPFSQPPTPPKKPARDA